MGPADFGLKVASDEELAKREELVDRVLHELARAGLPACRNENGAAHDGGAVVSLDWMVKEDGGGVFVEWQGSEELRRAAMGVPTTGELTNEMLHEAAKALSDRGDDPDLIHSGAVDRHMQAAMIGILSSAGLRAFDPADEYLPFGIQVEF
ncbi:hypothetical protein [Kutzneria chonburiensis]|uniref:Uncharacterized protein n=1 Tax=Kutzneria chonburiensis TaxID=1483604 RepID=A0ABV6MVM5_9PSEU|nr:hypothetical protein [Kutzneria chonburiensis]